MRRVAWIINEYAGSPYHGMEYRHYYIGRELVKKGYKVWIITASFSHLFFSGPKINSDFKLEAIDNLNYLWVKVPAYRNSHDKKRVIKWLIFASKVYFRLPIGDMKKPDVILVSSPSLFSFIPGYKWAKKLGAKLIFEVRDIWPLTLVELGGYSEKHPFIKLMGFLERFAYKKADRIISVLPLFDRYLQEKGFNSKKFVYIPNGICVSELSKTSWFPKIRKNGIPNNVFIVTYAGTFGKANALEYLIKAAELLKDDLSIRFILVGKGTEEKKLKGLASNKKLSNITFLPPVPKNQVQEILKFSDICYLGWRRKRLYRFGISANKIFDYMYSGVPILHSFSGDGDIVKQAQCGITVEAENPKAIAEGILKLYKMTERERKKLGENGRKYVLKYHTYEKIAEKLDKTISELWARDK